jgi:hypothetical protein
MHPSVSGWRCPPPPRRPFGPLRHLGHLGERSTLRLAACASILALASGCGANPASAPRAPQAPLAHFPSREAIAAIPPSPIPDAAFTDTAPVDRWEPPIARPAESAAYADAGPPGALAATVRALVAERGAPLSLDTRYRCAAETLARFVAHNGKRPNTSLRTFQLAYCGIADATALDTVLVFNGPADETAAASELEKPLRDDLAFVERNRATFAGSAVADGDDRRVYAVTVAQPSVSVAGAPFVAKEDGTVRLRGTVAGDVEQVVGLVNHGRTDVVTCDRNPRVELPSFEMTCRMAASDALTWAQLVVRRPKRLLAEAVGHLLLEKPGAELVYVAPSDPDDSRAPARAEEAIAFVNARRKLARRAPLTHAAAQSVENTRLLGPLLDARLRGDAARAEEIALGVLAGWEVPREIRDGGLFVTLLSPTPPGAGWVQQTLEFPLGRQLLLDESTRVLAVGLGQGDAKRGLGVVVSTYALFEAGANAKAAAAVFDGLAKARALRDTAATTKAVRFEGLEKHAARIHDEGLAPEAALDEAMHDAVATSGRSIHGYVLETHDVGSIPWPEALLSRPSVLVDVAVTHRKAPGAPWAHHVVLVLTSDGGG